MTPSSLWGAALRLVGALLVALPLLTACLLVVGSGRSEATPAAPYLVTLVARQCPTYTDIMANLARNNIQESLQDLGKNSVYSAGQPISPAVEGPNQPACTPLNGWKFTFGSGIAGKSSNLSTVSGPGAPVTVQPSVPLLDAQGRPTGQSIAAATTVTLTQAQVSAALSRKLWVQGGTPSDPLVTSSFGSRYAFGALRCSIDNLNGDNVEWVGFASGSTSVFCYYYAVDEVPASGTIVISKQLAVPEPQTNVFHFQGNVSYNPGGGFDVPVTGATPGSISFVRSSGVPWSFTEVADPAFAFQSLSCTGPGTSSFPAPSTSNPAATVTLGAGDTVVCAYTDARPAQGTLSLFKQTTGGVGGPFDFTVSGPALSATGLVVPSTTAPGEPVAATSASGAAFAPALSPGTYQFTEDLSAANAAAEGGTWSLAGFNCDGVTGTAAATPASESFVVTSAFILTGESLECSYTNLFTPDAGLTITKTTSGGVGSTDFVVSLASPPDDPSAPGTGEGSVSVLTAVTSHPGLAATAVGTGGVPLDPLAPGRYSIVEEGPEDTPLGTWSPVSIRCNGAATDPTSSDVLVTLTAADPHVTCAFTNAFTAFAPATTTTSTTTAASAGGGSSAASSTTPVPQLASTGTNVELPLGVAMAIVLAGLVLIIIDRVRSTRRSFGHSTDDDRSR